MAGRQFASSGRCFPLQGARDPYLNPMEFLCDHPLSSGEKPHFVLNTAIASTAVATCCNRARPLSTTHRELARQSTYRREGMAELTLPQTWLLPVGTATTSVMRDSADARLRSSSASFSGMFALESGPPFRRRQAARPNPSLERTSTGLACDAPQVIVPHRRPIRWRSAQLKRWAPMRVGP